MNTFVYINTYMHPIIISGKKEAMSLKKTGKRWFGGRKWEGKML